MSTPFDDVTWRLRYENPLPHYPTHEIDLTKYTEVATSLSSVFYPLKQQTTFGVNVSSDLSASVIFNEDTPENIREIWRYAEGVYYDAEFYTIRGDLHFDSHSGSQGGGHSHHFIITYRGRYGPGGNRRQLFVKIYEDHASFEPTADLVRRQMGLPKYFLSHRGSWKADD